jgi:hypothetical protein
MGPGIGNKRAQQLRAARTSKKQRQLVQENELPESLLHRVDDESEQGMWNPNKELPQPTESWDSCDDNNDDDKDEETDEEECEITDTEDEVTEFNSNAFNTLLAASKNPGVFEDVSFHYQRGSESSVRTIQRKEKMNRELQESAKGLRKIYTYFGEQAVGRPTPHLSREELLAEERTSAQKALIKKLESKKHALQGQNLMRHMAVLTFLRVQHGKQLGETRVHMAHIVARCFGKGIHFARLVVTWEREWIENREIPEGRRGCYSKTQSWFNDEGIQNAVRKWLQGRSGEGK